MNNEHVKGKLNQIKGRIKEEVGHKTGSEKTESEGVTDRVKGKLQEAYGDLKDKAKEAVDTLLKTNKDKKSA